MLLLLMRHADAGSHDPALFADDRLRPLTREGRKRHRKVSRKLRRRGFVPSLLLSSPWLRAWQTAEILATESKVDGLAPVACEVLAQPPAPEQLALAIGEVPEPAVVALVGHEPWLGELASLLLTGNEDGMEVDFPKSGVLAIDAVRCEAGAGRLVFFWRR